MQQHGKYTHSMAQTSNSCDQRYIRPSVFKWIEFVARHLQQMKHVDIQQDCGINEHHHRHFEKTADIFTVFVQSIEHLCQKGFISAKENGDSLEKYGVYKYTNSTKRAL